MLARKLFHPGVLLLLATLPFSSRLAAQIGLRGSSASGITNALAGPTLPAQFQATVYEVQTTADRVSGLDGKALAARAATADGLLRVLTNSGSARILYRIDQPVNVLSEQIQLGSSEPVVTGARMSATGQPVKAVTYQNVGVIVRLSAEAPPTEAKRRNPDVKLSVQLAVLAPSGIELAPGVPATTTRSMSTEHLETLEFDRPLVAVSVYSATTESQAAPTAYVIRYLFSPLPGK